MSKAISPSANKPYGLTRVCRTWQIPRSTVYARRDHLEAPRPPRKRGPQGPCSDEELLACIRAILDESAWVGEGHRKVWARLRFEGLRTSRRRVLRIMREHDLLAPTRLGRARGPRVHDGTIIPARPDQMWGIDGTATLTGEGQATIFILVDHCTGECLGIHAARRGTRFEALEPVRQAVWSSFGLFAQDIAAEAALKLRHDHGSQFVSYAFQEEIAFLGIESSPAFVRAPEGNGCAERFIRTLKEQLLWIHRFDTIADLLEALHDFKQRYNHGWIIERHGYATPAQQRERLLQPAREAA
jgi:transposase InsO family protein